MALKEVSFLKTCVSGINALAGIGILSTACALSSGGWLSLILLLLIATAAWFTGLLIRRCMDTDPHIRSYPDIAGRAFGRKGRFVASTFISLELYLVATGPLILEGDNLHKLSPHFALRLRNLTVDGRHSFVILSGVMILPSMLLNDMDVMSFVSAGGVISSLVVVVSVFCVGLQKEVGFHGNGRLIDLHGMPTALSLYTFRHRDHAVFPTIYSSMRKKNQFSNVLLIGFVIFTVTYLSMAILGYLMYGQNLQSQVTLNLPTHQVGSKIAIYTILAVLIAKYGLTITPIANLIVSFLPASYQGREPVSLLVRTCLLISTVVLAIAFPSFHAVACLSGTVLSWFPFFSLAYAT